MSDGERAEPGDEGLPDGRLGPMTQASSAISNKIRGAACWPDRSRLAVAALWAVLVLLALATITPSKADTPRSVYYAMEFDAEIEGERFTFETKVDCCPSSVRLKEWDPKLLKAMARPRIAYGKRLSSGKGVFVAAPRICGLYFSTSKVGRAPKWNVPEREKAILPLIYLTDNYENPNFLTFYTNPNGPDPKTGIRLIKCEVRALSVRAADKIHERKPDPRDPFYGEKTPKWEAFSFFRLSDDDADQVRTKLGQAILETERYRLYRHSEGLSRTFPRMITPLKYSSHYTQVVRASIPLNESTRTSRRKSYWTEGENEAAARLARAGYQTNLPLLFDGDTFTVDFENVGVLHAFGPEIFNRFLVPNRLQKLALDGADSKFDWVMSFQMTLVLQDLETGDVYAIYHPPLSMML